MRRAGSLETSDISASIPFFIDFTFILFIMLFMVHKILSSWFHTRENRDLCLVCPLGISLSQSFVCSNAMHRCKHRGTRHLVAGISIFCLILSFSILLVLFPIFLYRFHLEGV